MTTYLLSDAIEETRRFLLGMQRGEVNRLDGTITSNTETIVVEFDLAGIVRGSYIAIDDEIILVWTTDGHNTITACQRGMLGSTAASHTDAALIEVNPRFARFAVKAAIREEIRSWGPQLFRVASSSISTTSNTRGYDLTALGDFYGIVDVRRSTPLAVGMTDPMSWPRVDYRVLRKADTTSFTSGNALILTDVYPTSGDLPTLNVVYASPFDVDTAWADTTDLIATVGLSLSMVDIVPLGASQRLLATRDIRRTFNDDEADAANRQEVPVGAASGVAKELKRQRDARIADEQLVLVRKYPIINSGT